MAASTDDDSNPLLKKLVTEDEVKRMKRDGSYLLLNELLTSHLITAEECSEVAWKKRWMDHLNQVLSTKPAEVVQEACQVLETHGCSVKELKTLSELFTRHLLTAEECSEVAGKNPSQPPQSWEWPPQSWEWEDRLTRVLSTKPVEVVQEACQVLEKHGCHVEKLKILNELFTRHLLTAQESSKVSKYRWWQWGWEWKDHLTLVLSTKTAELIQEACQVLQKHHSSVKELKMLSELYQEKLVTKDEVKKMNRHFSDQIYDMFLIPGEEGYFPDQLRHIQSAKPLEVRTKVADVLDKFGYNKSAKWLRERPKGQTELSSEDVEEGAMPQGSMVHSQPVGGGSDRTKEPHTATVKTGFEAALDDLCWIPFGIQSQSVGPEGGKLCLEPSAGAMGGEEGETILLKVPPGAIRPSESVEVRSALMPDGPFTLPEDYQLGSMVVYLCYDGQCVTKPFTLSMPHWYGGEDQVRDGLSFAMAPHTLKEGEHVYRFELLEGGKMLSSHCGELEIDGHSSQFVVVFREGAMSRYQATSLIRERGNETRCHVAVTYAFPLWRGILKKYRHGWTVNEPSCSFNFGKLILKLQRESGNGWQAGIDGSHELQPCDVKYGSYGITDYKLLKKAVSTGGYPPTLQCAVTYKEVLRTTGRPVWVCMDLLGTTAEKDLTFRCNAYEEDYQQLEGRNAASAALQSLLTPLPDTRKSTTPPQAKTAEESLEKRVLNAYAPRFRQVVAVYRIYRKLREKKVIDQTVEKAITNSHNVEEARGRLFDHMRDYGTIDTLKIFCDVITSEEYDGIQAMQDLGTEIKTTLDQD